MVNENCIPKIIEASGGSVTQKEAESIIEELRQLKEEDFNGIPDSMAAKRFLKSIAEKNQREIKSAYITRLDSLKRTIQLEDDVSKAIKVFDIAQKKSFVDPVKEMLASVFGGTQQKIKGSANAISRKVKTWEKRFQAGLIQRFEKADLLDHLGDEQVNNETALLVEAMGKNKGKLPDDVSGFRPESIKAAEIINQNQRYFHATAQTIGMMIEDGDDYFVRQTHNANKMVQLGEKGWKDLIRDKLDFTKMVERFREENPRKAKNFDLEAYLSEAYKNIITGYHLNTFDLRTPKSSGGSRSTGSLNKARKIIFKDAASWLEYNNASGKAGYLETYIRAQSGYGKAIGLTESMRSDPQKYADGLIQGIQKQLREKFKDNPTLLAKYAESTNLQNRVDEYMSLLSGESSRGLSGAGQTLGISNQAIGVANKMLFSVNNLLLADIPITSLMDLPNMIEAAMHYGAPIANTIAKGIEFNFQGQGNRISKAVAEATYNGMSAVLAKANQSMDLAFTSLSDDPTSIASKTERTFFKWIGMTAFQDGSEQFATGFMGRFLGSMGDLKHGELNADLQRELSRHNILEREWNLFSEHMIEMDGEKLLLPETAKQIPDEKIKAVYGIESEEGIAQARLDLESKIQELFQTVNQDFVLKPDIQQERLKYKMGKASTLGGMLNAHVYQFKSYTLAMWNRITGPNGRLAELSAARGQGELGFYTALAGYTAVMCASWYIQDSLKQLKAGKTPIDLFHSKDPKELANKLSRIAAGGSGLGFATNVLIRQDMGRQADLGKMAIDLAGPTFAKAQKAFSIGANLSEAGSAALLENDPDKVDKKLRKAGMAATQLAQTVVPNTWYTKAAFDRLVFDNIKAALDPDYMDRKNEQLESMGQKAFIAPYQ